MPIDWQRYWAAVDRAHADHALTVAKLADDIRQLQAGQYVLVIGDEGDWIVTHREHGDDAEWFSWRGPPGNAGFVLERAERAAREALRRVLGDWLDPPREEPVSVFQVRRRK